MNSRHFDLFTRRVAGMGTRRTLLRQIALVGAAALTPAAVVRADSGTSGVGGSSTSSACPSNASRPTRKVTAVAPFPAFIVSGTCDAPTKASNFNLIDVGAEAGSAAKGKSDATVIPVVQSLTSLKVKLADLAATPHALVVRASSTDPTLIACGNLGSATSGNAFSVGIQERNGSGYSGVAMLSGTEKETGVNVFVARGLFETIGGAESAKIVKGDVVITIIDVNLRAKAADTGDVVAIIGQGSTLNVTGDPSGDWIPVQDPASGDSGFVNVAYVTKA